MGCTTPPDGFYLEYDAVAEASWERLQEWMKKDKSIPWEIAIEGRRVAQFGCRYSFTDQKVDHTPVAPIPNLLREVLPHLKDGGEYTQCIINCYGPNDGIPFHMDDRDFGETVLVYTFLEARALMMRRIVKCTDDINQTTNAFTAYPRHRSCYKLSRSARWNWEHSVPEGCNERISVTLRSIQKRSDVAT